VKIYKLKIYSNQGHVNEFYMPNKTLCKQIFKRALLNTQDGEHLKFTIQEEIIPSDKGGMCFWLNQSGISNIDSKPAAPPAPAARPAANAGSALP